MTNSHVEDEEGQNHAQIALPASAKGEVEEVIAISLYLGFLEKLLWREFLWVLLVARTIGKELNIDQDLSPNGDVVVSELGIVEVHVGHKEGDDHAYVETLFDDNI